MRRSRPSLLPAPSLVLALALAASACGGGGGADPASECTRATECQTPAATCLQAACVDGRCGTSPLPAGTVVDGGATGDCQRRVCDGAGAVISAADDTDLPADGNACTRDLCADGAVSHPAEEPGLACAQDGGSRCDGAGGCVQCLVAADCGADGECATHTCQGGACGVTLTPYGTPLAAQEAGDCRRAVCDGLGGTTTAPLDGDLPSDGNVCTGDLCSEGVVLHPPVAAGAPCSGPAGAVVCDGGGACVQCVSAIACPGSDGECQHRTCAGGTCGVAFEPAGTLVASQVAGDCKQDVCDGAGAVVRASLASDVPVDGSACTLDSCEGGVPSNPPAPAGTVCAQGGTVCDGSGTCVACNVGADCGSGVCVAHACQAPTCADLTRNGTETDVDCGGIECPRCAPPLACTLDSDCTTLICHHTLLRCELPSCTDGTQNGNESDVDCGGTCPDCARGRRCTMDGDCQTGNCQSGVCGGPRVTAVIPADGASDVTRATAVSLFLGSALDSASLTAQTSSGPCSGSVQISADGFASCVGVSSKFVRTNPAVAVVEPAVPLAGATPYRVRTTTALLSTTLGAFEPFETSVGFTTAGGDACGGALVISQVYPGGGLAGSSYAKDFVELHNNGAVPVSLSGLSLQHASATGTAWSVTPLSGTLPPGAYFLVQEAGGTLGGAPLPTPGATGTIALYPSGGKLALVSTTVAPADYSYSCLSVGVLDLVGYGGSSGTPTPCHEGAGAAPVPVDDGAALARAGGGCADGNGNAVDFASQLAVPRNGASPPAICGCNGLAVNGTGLTIEMDWCDVHAPLGLTAAAGATVGPVFGRVVEFGITGPAGMPPIAGELGYGPAGTDPRYAAGWTFIPATWSAQQADDSDEFQASFDAPVAGSYVYVYRFTADGQRFTYCDPNGAGANPGNPFEPNTLPPLTVP
jgi:hypothetical protein